MSAVFVFLTVSTKKSEATIASGGFFLSNSLGEVTGLSAQSAILQIILKRTLEQRLAGVAGGADVSRQIQFYSSGSAF
jgi:hypothetical protein